MMKRLKEEDARSLTIIKINAGGGPVIMTTLNTLTLTFPQSVIARQFSHLDMIPRDSEDNYFIDTDPVVFSAIVNVLRRPDLLEIVPRGIDEEVWWGALDYWGLKEYVVVTTSPFEKSVLENASKIMSVIEHNATLLTSFERKVVGDMINNIIQDLPKITPLNRNIGINVDKEVLYFDQSHLEKGLTKPVKPVDAKVYTDLVYYMHSAAADRFRQHFEALLPSYRITLSFINDKQLAVESVNIQITYVFENHKK